MTRSFKNAQAFVYIFAYSCGCLGGVHEWDAGTCLRMLFGVMIPNTVIKYSIFFKLYSNIRYHRSNIIQYSREDESEFNLQYPL